MQNKIAMISKCLALLTAVSATLMLVACDREKASKHQVKSTETHHTTVANNPPHADAGEDLIVRVGELITLNGTQSSDPDHDLMSFNWKQESGPSVDLQNATTLTPSFIAPASKQPLVFSLVVSDGQADSAPDQIKIMVSNRAPVANAGKTILAQRGEKIVLNGTGSIDPDNDRISYKWEQVYGQIVELDDPASATPSLRVPNNSGYMIFALVVTDVNDESIADTVAVKVANTPPVAKVQQLTDNVIAGKPVKLDGSMSSDPEGDALAYAWNQILGTPVLLQNANGPTPSFIAPERPDHLVFELRVNDGEFTSHADSLIVSVKNETQPIEIVPDSDRIAKMKEEAHLAPVKREKSTLAVTSAPAAVENFLPEIAETFVPAANAAMNAHDSAKENHPLQHKMHWGYEGKAGPEHWASLDNKFELCGNGKNQSPIDIQTGGMHKQAEPIEFHYTTSTLNIVNNGHTIQANYDPGSYAVIRGKRYDLLQFHFHSPSEHTIDGKAADMVAHLVHKSPDDGSLAVVGVLFNKGKESDFLNPIWANLPQSEGSNTASPETIFAANLLPEDKSYYHYTGSLTTPPCSEGVNWNVMATPVEVSSTQVEAFNTLFSKSVRPVQGLHGRVVSMH